MDKETTEFEFCIGRPYEDEEDGLNLYAFNCGEVEHGTTEDALNTLRYVNRTTGEQNFVYRLVKVELPEQKSDSRIDLELTADNFWKEIDHLVAIGVISEDLGKAVGKIVAYHLRTGTKPGKMSELVLSEARGIGTITITDEENGVISHLSLGRFIPAREGTLTLLPAERSVRTPRVKNGKWEYLK